MGWVSPPSSPARLRWAREEEGDPDEDSDPDPEPLSHRVDPDPDADSDRDADADPDSDNLGPGPKGPEEPLRALGPLRALEGPEGYRGIFI